MDPAMGGRTHRDSPLSSVSDNQEKIISIGDQLTRNAMSF